MYRLVIVDDESIIREGLKQTVNWETLGFQVVGEADNGRSALEIIKEVSPDVVLADIRMPEMDGLTMLKNVKKNYPDIKIVLLSGHEEFEYAREGMLLGAEGYILKLSIESDVPEVFGRIHKKLDEEERARNMVNDLKAERRELIYDIFLRRAINGEVTGDDVKSLLSKEKDIPLLEGSFCCVCIQLEVCDEKAGDDAITSRKRSIDEFFSKIDFKADNCNELLLLQPGCKFVIIYYSKSVDTESLYRRITCKWNESSRCFLRNSNDLKWKAFVGIGNVAIGWEAIYQSYFQARKAAMFKTTRDVMMVLEWKDVKGMSFSQVLSVKEQNELIQSIVMGDCKFVQQQLNYLFKSFESKEEPLNMQDVQQFFIELLVLIKWKLRELDISMEEYEISSTETNKRINSIQEYAELSKWTRGYVLKITERCYEIRKQPSKKSILKAAGYIESNFSEKILLEEMANYVHMSPSHFSVLFKQHTGRSFTKYLMDVRMEQAKKLLEEKHAVNEVAERVGYQDMRHFSKTFKKYYGVNPSEV